MTDQRKDDLPDDVAEAVYRMRQHNKWRKGDDSVPMTDSVQLGLDIETVCRAASIQSAEVRALRLALAEISDMSYNKMDAARIMQEKARKAITSLDEVLAEGE